MDQLTALDRFQRALMTWQHPDASMAPAVVSALSGSKSAQGLLDARKAAWQEAFRSLFMTLRAGACPAFYLATAQVHHSLKYNLLGVPWWLCYAIAGIEFCVFIMMRMSFVAVRSEKFVPSSLSSI